MFTSGLLNADLRRRLEALNREQLTALPHPFAAADGGARRIDTAHTASPQRGLEVLRGTAESGPGGDHYRVRRPLVEFWRQGAAEIIAWQRDPPAPVGADRPRDAELTAFAQHFPSETLFLDLETVGFAGSMVFLIGLIRFDGSALVVDQLLARDYSEEAALLGTLGQILAQQRVLVTFNGKSFDSPMLADRLARHRLPELAREPLVHCDLLHHARRRWKTRLPDCKLQTLERVVCRRRRAGDIPGAEIPGVYHEFVRTGDAARLARVLEHNALDLITLVQIALRIVRGV